MEIIKENNCFVFKSEKINDFTIHLVLVLSDKQIKVNKSLVMSESDYFKAMFESVWNQNNNNFVKLEETLIKPFINVIKLCYALDFTEEEWNALEIQEINESIIIANKYQFIRIEKLMSEKVIQKFPSIKTNFKSLSLVMDLFEMSKNFNLFDLNNECLNYFDENANQIIKTIDKLFITPELLHLMIIRDTFGVNEIELFNGIMNWIRKSRLNFNYKYYPKEQKLLEAIRFELISAEVIENEVKPDIRQLYSRDLIEDIFHDVFKSNQNHNKRVSIQPEIVIGCKQRNKGYLFYNLDKNNSFNEKNAEISQNFLQMDELLNAIIDDTDINICESIEYCLAFIYKINCIEFKISGKIDVKYIIEVRDIETKDKIKWKTVIDYRKFICEGSQQLFFDDIITDSIRIICISSVKQLYVRCFGCKYTKTPPKLLNNTVLAVNDIIAIEGTNCWIRIGNENDLLIPKSDILMKNVFERHSKLLIDHKIKLNSSEFRTHYYVTFCQPFAINSFQFDVKLETDNSSDKYYAVFEVLILSECSFDSIDLKNDTKNWVKVSNALIEKSVTCNVVFDLQTVCGIKISGFQFKRGDKQLKIALHLRGIKVPANQESVEWICGKTLSLSETNDDINEMLALFH